MSLSTKGLKAKKTEMFVSPGMNRARKSRAMPDWISHQVKVMYADFRADVLRIRISELDVIKKTV